MNESCQHGIDWRMTNSTPLMVPGFLAGLALIWRILIPKKYYLWVLLLWWNRRDQKMSLPVNDVGYVFWLVLLAAKRLDVDGVVSQEELSSQI